MILWIPVYWVVLNLNAVVDCTKGEVDMPEISWLNVEREMQRERDLDHTPQEDTENKL